MRYLIALSVPLCHSAIAEDQPYNVQLGCAGPDIVVQVAMGKPGVLTFKIPHNYCGSDV
jgi:hypothetical protein